MPNTGSGLSDVQRAVLGEELKGMIERAQNEDKLTEDERKKLRELLRDFEAIKKLVESRRVTVTVYTAIGEFAKWAGGVIALIVAYKTLISGGSK